MVNGTCRFVKDALVPDAQVKTSTLVEETTKRHVLTLDLASLVAQEYWLTHYQLIILNM